MNLNYKKLGEEGFPIVILHGLFGMLDNWQTIGKKLSELGFVVYLLDQRDHGKSAFTDEFNYKILSEDLREFLDENSLSKCHLIGHSMGGKTIMQFAFDYPEYIAKMVVVDICNKAYKGGHEIIFEAINSINVENIENRQTIYDHLKSYDLDEGTTQFLLKNLQRKTEGGYEWKMNHKLLEREYENILNTVGRADSTSDVPTLFIKGGKSNYISLLDEENISKQFTDSEIMAIDESGHWVHAEKPAELFNEVVRFLN
jgi:esterase